MLFRSLLAIAFVVAGLQAVSNASPVPVGIHPFLEAHVARIRTEAAQGNPGAPAVIELIVPAGATATADGVALGDRRTISITDLKLDEIRRVKLAVKFADGSVDERLVDVSAGQHIPVPVPEPGPDKPVVVATQLLTPINAAAISRDGRYFALGLEERAVVLWDTSVGRPVRTLAGHQKVILSVAFSPDGKQLLSGSADATAILWDVGTGAKLRTYKGHTGAVVSTAFSPDGTKCLTGSPDGTAILWSTQTAEPIHTIKSKEIFGVAYSPDGTRFATASVDNTATLWDAVTGKPSVVLKGHKEGVSSVAFSPDGKKVLTGSFENIGIVWDSATGKRVAATGRHGNDVYSVAFTRDGRRVLTGDREEIVMMWDAATGAQLRTFAGHTADVVSIIPSLNGRMLLTGSRDGTARLWDLATGRELLALTTDATRKTWAVVSPDGLFDASESGRRAVGFRFTKLPGMEIDQIFRDCYRPGLLAEVWRGERPGVAKPLGRQKPPLVRIIPPKSRVSATAEATIDVDVTDQGGGMSDPIVENNGVRVVAAVKSARSPDGKATRYTLTIPLVPGANKLRVRSSNRDGSWDSAASELELTLPRVPGQMGRMYVVAVGISSYAEKGLTLSSPVKDARALAELLQSRAAKLYERVDIVPVYDRNATKETIEDTIKDVAELTRPQDAVVVLLCGHAALLRDRFYFAPHDLRTGMDRPCDALCARGVSVDDLAAALGKAPALHRVLVVDAAASGVAFPGEQKDRSEFALRGTVERWAKLHGIHTLAATAASTHTAEQPDRQNGLLTQALLAAASDPEARELNIVDWFQSALKRTGSSSPKLADVEASSKSKGFTILTPGK